ncbi:protein Flattop, partial [Heptranchias perlo]|uniref:protein Flattop n=1 Tax=Heptranchias perlo TaxID=212740 RepID=UPI003559CAE3
MAYSYHANQFESGYNNTRMKNWIIPKQRDRTSKRPKFREGSSFFIANDRGCLHPTVPRAQVRPWGTFLGTWDMPHRIPPPQVNLTARSPEAGEKLLSWLKSSPLNQASNGIVPLSLFP